MQARCEADARVACKAADLVVGVIERGGLRRAQINARRGRVYPDLRRPERRLTVECDGAAWHDGKLAREDDAERQARLQAGGERVLRVTWRQAFADPQQTVDAARSSGAPRA